MGLELKNIHISLAGRKLFQPLSANVGQGDVLTIMGPSGSGKSTLLDFMSGGLAPAFTGHGHVILNGMDITSKATGKRQVGMLFQDDLLFPHLSVGENLSFGVAEGVSKAEKKALLQQALIDADLIGFEERDPATLSGGQRARVSCMRMLLAKPKALLLDEPFSKLDQNLRDRFRSFVFDHAKNANLPVILVTHDEGDAKAAGGSILHLEQV